MTQIKDMGKTVYYSLDDHHIEQLLKMAFEHVNE